jgi:molybdate transport system ATP-binding protein
MSQKMRIALRLTRPGFELAVDLRLPGQGVTVLFGPSGSGKTTLLRCVAGLEQASGQVLLHGAAWQDSAQGVFLPTWRRELGYVFQEASLFEHLNVKQNLRFGLERVRSASAARALDAALDLLGIGHLQDRAVASLSGGERQRVAMARALATEPKLLLLDEPMAALDVARKQEVLPWLQRLRSELQIPMLYVTHSVDELAQLADHVVVLRQGQVISSASAQAAWVQPEVALAVGEQAGSLASGRVCERDSAYALAQIEFEGGLLWVRDQGLQIGQSVRLRILARDVSLSVAEQDHSTIANRLAGTIESIHPDSHPSQALARVRCGSALILARVTHRSLQALSLKVGSLVWCQIKSVALMG